MTAPGSPTSIPRQSSLQRALSELDIKSKGSTSEDDVSVPRINNRTSRSKKVLGSSKSSSSLHKEVRKITTETFLEQFERQAELRGKIRL
jgi:hypothetical protein